MILAGCCAALLAVCCQWQTVASASSTPGLKFIPMPDPTRADNTLIYYKATDMASVRKWTSKIDDFLKEYTAVPSDVDHIKTCAPNSPPTGDYFCDVPVDQFHPCTSENYYNYHKSTPCVFLKLDKVLNWTPQVYNTTEDLPEDMTEYLKQHISFTSGKEDANVAWVSCDGETPADVEFLGPRSYFPRPGFPLHHFPYTGLADYRSPLVAVWFERPMTGILISVECKVWAKNIAGDSVHFELMVD